MGKWKFLSALFLIVLACLLLLYRNRVTQPSFPKRPNIIIYLVDTLRRDHLNVYGYSRNTSPNLKQFRQDSVLFEDAYTPAPWTRPATASLLSGLLPRDHGAVSTMERIRDSVPLLANYLKDAGYRTATFSTNPQVLPVWGFDRGVDLFVDVRNGTADKVVKKVTQTLPKFSKNQPFFFYIHTIDPHGSKNPVEPFVSLWRRHDRAITKRASINPETPRTVVDDAIVVYDEQITLNDYYFGLLIRFLKKNQLYDNTLIFYVADHGEELQDHGYGGHCHSMYQELLRIPMIMKLPGNRYGNSTIQTRVWLPDIVPTILAMIGRRPDKTLPGTDLLKLMETDQPQPPRTFLFDLDAKRPDGTSQIIRAIYSGNFKYVERVSPWKDEQLFDELKDPHEKINLINSKPDIAETLGKQMERDVLQNEGGTYLHFVNDSSEQTVTYRGTLTSNGLFTNVRAWQLEATDSVQLGPDQKHLTFAITLKNIENPIHPGWVIDEDTIAFRVDPPDAEVILDNITCSNCSSNALFVGEHRQLVQSLPLRFSQSKRDFLIAMPTVQFVRPGGYLFIVPYQKATEVHVDKDTEERLQSLGYMQ